MGKRPAPVPGVDLLFTDDDAVEILDYLADEHLTCPGCGQPRVESMAKENTYGYRAVAMNCHACDAKRRAEKAASDDLAVYSFVEKRF